MTRRGFQGTKRMRRLNKRRKVAEEEED